jgi:hypothetical protein
MYLASQQLRSWRLRKPRYSNSYRRLIKDQRLTAKEKRRYFWQAVLIAIVLLAASTLGALLGYYVTD